jgi:adenosylhomocysteine nucleosidase
VDAAARAFAAVEQDGPISFAISTGWSGALNEKYAAGRAYRVSGVVDARTGERFSVASWFEERWLVTSPKVADEAEKQRLAAAYQAGLVDMEAAAIARLAGMRGIPFYCIKGVSDGRGEKLPDFNRFIAPDGRFRIVRFVLFALLRPWYWPVLMRMGENGKKAAQGIADSLLDFLDERETIRKQNGYPNSKH